MDMISRMLEQVDDWRHLPAYQLERRVDVLFGMLLPTVIGAKFEVNPDDCRVIPEFPLHKGKLEGSDSNQSGNVDFAVFFEKGNRKHLCLVELKTDQKSIKENQIETMGKAREAGARELFVGVLKAANASPEPRKYAHLIWKLHEIGCIELPDIDGFRKMPMEQKRPGLTGKTGQLERLEKANVVSEAWSDSDIDLIGIVPHEVTKEEIIRVFEKHRFCLITFKKLADMVGKATVQPFGVEFAETFASFLHGWDDVPAGKKRLSE